MTSTEPNSVGQRVPSLDGLRALSIGLVVIAHLVGTRGTSEWLVSLNGAVDIGNLGVRTFFVISGYLITTLLLREHRATGAIHLRKFYVRRSLRIFPAFYAYLLGVFLASRVGLGKLDGIDLAYAATFTINYLPTHGFAVSHLWSLAVEEQFYLLWPSAIAFLSPRRALVGATVFVLICPVLRLGGLYDGVQPGELDRRFEFVADALAIGCILAGLSAGAISFGRRIERAARIAQYVIPSCAVILLFTKYTHPVVWYGVGISVVNLALAQLVHHAIRPGSGAVVRLLNSRPIVLVGVLSYSLYLWQQPFLDAHHHRWYSGFPVNVVLALLVAVLSYVLVERPVLRVRDRVLSVLFSRPRSDDPR